VEPWGEEQGWQRNQKLLELQLASKRAESRETWTATEKDRERERVRGTVTVRVRVRVRVIGSERE